MHPVPFKDGFQIPAHGLFREPQCSGNLAIAQAACDQTRDLLLPLGQPRSLRHFERLAIEGWLAASQRFARVESYADAETALEEIPEVTPVLCVVDIGLPGMKRDELIWRLVQTTTTIKSIAVSGIPDNSVVFRALDAGAVGFLDKPVNRQSFIREIDSVLAGGCPLAERARHLLIEEYRKSHPCRFRTPELSDREFEIAVHRAYHGRSDCEIAQELNIAVHTVRTHVRNIHEKLGIHNRLQLLQKMSGGGEDLAICEMRSHDIAGARGALTAA